LDPQQRIVELEEQLRLRDEQIVGLLKQIASQQEQLATQQARIAVLEEKIAELVEKVGSNSRNSQKPPSSDGPGQRNHPLKPRKKSHRKRGGQKGHRGCHRELVPHEHVNRIIDLFPEQCENCWKPLPKINDPHATRTQVTELPPIVPVTTEYRQHTVECADCGYKTKAKDKGQIPASPFGARLMSVIGLLTGVYHLSRRTAGMLLSDIAGVRISLGGISRVEARVSDAVQAPVLQAWNKAKSSEVKHTDSTSWLKAGVALSLWTIATKMVTVFKILADGTIPTVKPLFGTFKGILISDRTKVLGFWAMERRQICWAHLLRKFVSFSERYGPAKAIGNELLNLTGIVFQYWHDYRDGKLCKSTFQAWMVPVRREFEALLERAKGANIARLSGSCADVLAHKMALWTFVEHDGVEPTNNHAERELREFVLWRKRCFGAQSDRGNVFAERMMTIAHTARKQNKNVLAFLTECCQAHASGLPAPSLFESSASLAA
jgi:transposase